MILCQEDRSLIPATNETRILHAAAESPAPMLCPIAAGCCSWAAGKTCHDMRFRKWLVTGRVKKGAPSNPWLQEEPVVRVYLLLLLPSKCERFTCMWTYEKQPGTLREGQHNLLISSAVKYNFAETIKKQHKDTCWLVSRSPSTLNCDPHYLFLKSEIKDYYRKGTVLTLTKHTGGSFHLVQLWWAAWPPLQLWRLLVQTRPCCLWSAF